MNYGLLQENIAPKDWIVGAMTPLEGVDVLQEDGQWDEFLPTREVQNTGFDNWSCVSYSLLNCLETLLKRKTGVEYNFSDRFVSAGSGTTVGTGNYLSTVFDFVRKNGLVSEELYADALIKDEYFKTISQEIYNNGLEILNDYKFSREWIYPYNDFLEDLKQSPLQVTVKGIKSDGEDVVSPTGKHNHAVMLYGYVKDEYWKIFDSYDNICKKYAWDYQFGSILKPTINNNIMEKPTINENALVSKATGKGQNFAVLIDGVLRTGTDAEVQKTWTLRNSDFNNKRTITEEQWNAFEQLSL